MFKNLFKKKSPPPAPKSETSIFGALGGSPYRTQEPKTAPLLRKQPKKPYKLPSIGYLLVGFVSCLMAGVVPDAVNRFVPEATATPAAAAMAFMFLSFFCGFQANQKWKH